MKKTFLFTLLIITCISCNSSGYNELLGSFINAEELKLEPINIPITEEFESNYRYVSFWDDERVYFMNEKRMAINQFNFKTGKAESFRICDEITKNDLFNTIIVNKSFFLLKNSQNLWLLNIDKDNPCLKISQSFPISEQGRIRVGFNWPGSYSLSEGFSIVSKEFKKPSLLGQELILPTYPLYMKGQQREHLFVKLNLDNGFLEPIQLSMPPEFWELYEKYPSTEPYHILWNNKLVFHFMWSPEIFVYDFKTSKITAHVVEGLNIKSNIKGFESEETSIAALEIYKKLWSINSQQFKELIWLPEQQIFYRVEMKDKLHYDKKFADDKDHYINVISKDFKPLYSFEVPEGAIPLPIPMGKKVYFQMVNEENEDEIRFVAIDPMNIAKSK